MTANSIQYHDRLVSEAAEKYRQQGYEMVIEPQIEDLPFDLGSYHPDLIVKISAKEGYLVEIKSSASRTSIERYREIAEKVSQFAGWRFLLITGEDALFDSPWKNADHLLSWDQIVQRKEQADRLVTLGESESAFMPFWAIMEVLLRKQAEKTSIPIERFPTLSLIKHLYTLGELSMEQYDKAMELLHVRNSFVHGYQTPNLGIAVKRLRELINELIDLWGPSQSSQR